MNLKTLIIHAFFGISFFTCSQAELFLVDTIKTVVYGPESTDIITASDIRRPGIDGAFHTIDEKIDEKLMFQDAVRFKMLPEPEAIDKQLKAVQRDNNLTHDQLKEIFKASGYTYEEGKPQFQTMTAVNQIVNFRVMGRIIVSDKEIEAYYHAHPEMIEASYYIRRAEVPFAQAADKKALQSLLQTDAFYNTVGWTEPFWIEESELAADKFFITKMKKNQISIHTLPAGYEIFELVDKKDACLRSLPERYEEILNQLRQPKYQELFTNYKNELLRGATVVYLPEPQQPE